jgi:ribosomal protein S18 acetylase RimI-like enzyme
MNVIIRDYKSSDYEMIQEVWQETGLGGSQRGDNQVIIEHSLKLGGKLFVLEEKETGRIIGTSWITFDGRRLHLHHIGVLTKFQGKGYGKWLTRESLAYSKQTGYQIKLEVNDKNTNAIELYKKLGFQRLGDYDIYIVRKPNEINL